MKMNIDKKIFLFYEIGLAIYLLTFMIIWRFIPKREYILHNISPEF